MQSMGLIYSQTDTTPSKPLGMRVRLVPGELSAVYLDANPTLSKTTLEAALLGEHELMYVKNDEASTALAYGDCVVVDVAGTDPFNGVLAVVGGTTGVSTPGILGFALGAIAAGSYGWIVTKGVTYARADSTSANQQGAFLTTYSVATAGCVKTGTPATEEETLCMAGYGVTSAAATIQARFLIRCNL